MVVDRHVDANITRVVVSQPVGLDDDVEVLGVVHWYWMMMMMMAMMLLVGNLDGSHVHKLNWNAYRVSIRQMVCVR